MSVTVRDVWQRAQSFWYLCFGKRHLCGCGHQARGKTRLIIDGVPGIYTLEKNRDHCPECWLKAAIKCAWCGKTILPGDAITLYIGKPETRPPYAVRYDGALGDTCPAVVRFVGCLRMNCADSAADRQGFWIMPGKVHRVASAVEMLLAGMKDGNDCKAVFEHDLQDIRQAIPVSEQIEKGD